MTPQPKEQSHSALEIEGAQLSNFKKGGAGCAGTKDTMLTIYSHGENLLKMPLGDVVNTVSAHARLLAQNEMLRKALEGLLDGLDANAEPEVGGLSDEQWHKRIKSARAAIEQAEKV